jgi:hypothetical protein
VDVFGAMEARHAIRRLALDPVPVEDAGDFKRRRGA